MSPARVPLLARPAVLRSGATAGSSSSASFGCHCWLVQQCFATAENNCGRVSHCCAQVSRPRTSFRPQVSRSSKLLHGSREETCGRRVGDVGRRVPTAVAGRVSRPVPYRRGFEMLTGTQSPLLDEPAVAHGHSHCWTSQQWHAVTLLSVVRLRARKFLLRRVRFLKNLKEGLRSFQA
jgi:hypothetical protein